MPGPNSFLLRKSAFYFILFNTIVSYSGYNATDVIQNIVVNISTEQQSNIFLMTLKKKHWEEIKELHEYPKCVAEDRSSPLAIV